MEFKFHNSCYSRACAQYSDFLDRAQLLTQKLAKGYVSPRLKSSLQTFYDRRHNLVDRYEISSITAKTFTGLDCIYE